MFEPMNTCILLHSMLRTVCDGVRDGRQSGEAETEHTANLIGESDVRGGRQACPHEPISNAVIAAQ